MSSMEITHLKSLAVTIFARKWFSPDTYFPLSFYWNFEVQHVFKVLMVLVKSNDYLGVSVFRTHFTGRNFGKSISFFFQNKKKKSFFYFYLHNVFFLIINYFKNTKKRQKSSPKQIFFLILFWELTFFLLNFETQILKWA